MNFMLYLLRFWVVCITLIAIVHFQNWHVWSFAANTNPVCDTAECKKLGTLYRQYMNENGQACTDFYDYVCHNWGIYQPRPGDIEPAVSWNVDVSLDYRALQNVRVLLENTNASVSVDFERAKRMYRMCMNIPFWSKSNVSDLRNVMKKIGNFPLLLPNNAELPSNLSFWEIHQRYLTLTGESPLFDFKIAFHPQNPSEIITHLEELSSPYGAISRNLGWSKPDELRYYKAFLNDIIQSLMEKNNPTSKQHFDDIKDVIQFRDKLNLNIAMLKFGDRESRIVTIKEFQNWYNEQPKSGDPTDTNWLEVIRTIYKNSLEPRGLSVTDKSKVYVQFKYFAKLLELLGNTPKKVIVNHIHLYFAERHMERNSQMQVHLQQSVTDVGVSINGVIRIQYRWRKCLESLDMTNVLENLYLSSHFQKKDKLKTQELFDTSKKLLEQMIFESTWLPSSVKNNLIDKARKIKGLIGYSDSNDRSKQSRTEVEKLNSLKAIARYSNRLNEVYAAAAYLQWPVYSPNLPHVIEYGATVSVFGHELYHAFDQDGIQCTAQGTASWFPEEIIKEYKKHIICFRDRFEKLKKVEIKRLKLPAVYDVVFDQTLDEDMADAMGLKLAFTGFQQILKKNKGVCSVLPGFETFGCEKLFFIAFANGMCSSLSTRQEAMVVGHDTHNLPRIRVNGAVANMKEFSAAFGCKINDPLYLNQTCDLWK